MISQKLIFDIRDDVIFRYQEIEFDIKNQFLTSEILIIDINKSFTDITKYLVHIKTAPHSMIFIVQVSSVMFGHCLLIVIRSKDNIYCECILKSFTLILNYEL